MTPSRGALSWFESLPVAGDKTAAEEHDVSDINLFAARTSLNVRPTSKTIFVSHAPTQKAFVNRLVAELQKALGHDFAFVTSDAEVDDGFVFEDVSQLIRRSDLMVYVASEDANESLIAQAELAWGLSQSQSRNEFRIIPLLLGRPETVPHLLRNFLYIDFRDSDRFERGVAALSKVLSKNFYLDGGGNNIDRSAAEDAFIDLQDALQKENLKILNEINLRREAALRKILLTTAACSVIILGAIAASMPLTSLNDWFFVFNSLVLLITSVSSVYAVSAGSISYLRERAAKINFRLGADRSDPERDDRR